MFCNSGDLLAGIEVSEILGGSGSGQQLCGHNVALVERWDTQPGGPDLIPHAGAGPHRLGFHGYIWGLGGEDNGESRGG